MKVVYGLILLVLLVAVGLFALQKPRRRDAELFPRSDADNQPRPADRRDLRGRHDHRLDRAGICAEIDSSGVAAACAIELALEFETGRLATARIVAA